MGIRTIQGLLSLSRQHAATVLNTACVQAISYNLLRLADVRRLLAAPDCQQKLELLQEHPLIRGLDVYAAFVADQSQPQPQPEEVHS